ncbi:tRNA-splicing endonuclease subunit [Ceratobasidium sp. 414]|nr:tRNA-splicing endonuclease subunit [Ceratobasidium sp. 414]
MPRHIPLHVSNQTAYVWCVDGASKAFGFEKSSLTCLFLKDIATLRTAHRICGTLTGTLPSISQQNVFLGVPLTLLPEEVVTLVDTGAACIIDDSQSHGPPTREQLEAWSEARRASIAKELKERDAVARTTVKIDTSDKAQKKREARKAAKQPQPHEQVEINVLEPAPTPNDSANTSTQPHTVHVPSLSSDLAWYDAQAYYTIADARDAGVWTYPSDVKERAECAVFRDLWEKGNYLGPGIKFGGNYLVYPGSFILTASRL